MVVDGVQPGAVATPADPQELAATLADATARRKTTILTGGGSKLSWGRTPAHVDLLVSTARLTQLVAHRYGDLTATIECGARLEDVNRQLALHGQWLPIDSAFDAATIGGIVATNDAGPLRHRYGTPRDLLIGVTLALADGRQVKAGGTVVKNVAGYDLGRLVTGSFGSFAAITTATFKLAPIPAASGSMGTVYRDPESLARDAQLIAANQFELTTLDVQATFGQAGSEYRLLVRVASSPAATEAQLAAAQRMVTGEAERITGSPEGELWRDQVRGPWLGEHPVVRLAWLPASLAGVLTSLERMSRATGAQLTLSGRTAVGAGVLRIDAAPEAAVTIIEQLRQCRDLGNVVVLRAPSSVKSRIDVWGTPGSAAPVMRAIKQALDPSGILNADRGPI